MDIRAAEISAILKEQIKNFGQEAEGYLRFSYASSRAKINEAMDRLGEYLKARGAGAKL